PEDRPPAAPPQPVVTPRPVVAPPVVTPAPAVAPQHAVPQPPTVAAYGANGPGANGPGANSPGFGAPGFGPPTPLPAQAAPATAPTPAPRRRRKGPLIGAVAGVVLVAVLAVAGIQLLGDKKDDGGSDKAGPAAVTTTATTPAPETTEPTPDVTSEEPTAEPASADPTDPASTEPDPSGSPTNGDPGAVDGSDEVDLTGFSPIDGLDRFTVESATLNARDYGSAFVTGCSSESTIEFNLSRKWETLQFTAGIADDSPTEQARITISVDDQPALFSEAVKLGKPVAASFPVKGALRLRIRVEDTCTFSQKAYVVIAAPLLKR
ncbi:NPCBM/NEW2 domain-containing protein, partial [Streptomyces cinereoruber]|uniref:NPCBM/NEW2 domain-containing protein n=1 Tax=Streptomyces cinereoruber TaxID=67260 RepID=UPI003EBB47A7